MSLVWHRPFPRPAAFALRTERSARVLPPSGVASMAHRPHPRRRGRHGQLILDRPFQYLLGFKPQSEPGSSPPTRTPAHGGPSAERNDRSNILWGDMAVTQRWDAASAAMAVLRAVFPQPAPHAKAMTTWGGLSVIGATAGNLLPGVVSAPASWRLALAFPVAGITGRSAPPAHRGRAARRLPDGRAPRPRPAAPPRFPARPPPGPRAGRRGPDRCRHRHDLRRPLAAPPAGPWLVGAADLRRLRPLRGGAARGGPHDGPAHRQVRGARRRPPQHPQHMTEHPRRSPP